MALIQTTHTNIKGGELMKNIKVEQITLYIASNKSQTDNAFDYVIESVMESSFLGDYTLLDYDNPTEYKLVKKGK